MTELSSRVAAAFRRPAAEQDTTVPDPHSHRLLPHHRNDTQRHICSLAYKTNSFHYHVFFISSKYTNQESGLKLVSKLDNNEN